MPKVELLSPDQHQHLKIKTGVDQDYNDQRNLIAVVAGELPQLCLDYPVFLTKHETEKSYEMVAVVGFSGNENLFIENNHLKSLYVPLDIRRQPFQACFVDGNSANLEGDIKIGINVHSNRINESQGQAVFDNQGRPTKFVNDVSEILASMVRGLQSTQAFIKALQSHELIEAVTLNIQLPDGSEQKLEGLYGLNKQKLAALSGESLNDFHKNGYLQAAHAMIHSVGHIQRLINWKMAKLTAKN